MASLISPGVQVQIIDDSFYIPGNIGTVPLFFVATADEKLQMDGESPAIGTYESGVLRTVTSLKQSLELYGVPRYLTSTTGQQYHGDCRNEYGLDALNKFLEVGRRAYVVRANVNLDDSLDSLQEMWTRKIQIAADLLNQLVVDYLAAYNDENGLTPIDPSYKVIVTDTELKVLIDTSLEEVFENSSFANDYFKYYFLTDNTVATGGYHEVIYDSSVGFVTSIDVTGLDVTETYAFTVTVGATELLVAVDGADCVTFGAMVTAIQTSLNAAIAAAVLATPALVGMAATVTLTQGRIRIKNGQTGVTHDILIVDGDQVTTPTSSITSLPLFVNTNLVYGFSQPVGGSGPLSLKVFDQTTSDFGVQLEITGTPVVFTGLYDTLPATATSAAAEALLITQAGLFAKTYEFFQYSRLGGTDAERRTKVVTALQAVINNPYTGTRAEGLEYDLIVTPGFPEVVDEELRLHDSMFGEPFIIGDTPMDKPPTGPNSIEQWAVSTNKKPSDGVAYYYGHGISSNIDGVNILTTAASTAARVYVASDYASEVWFAPAGTTRGRCTHLETVGFVSGTLGGPTTFVENLLDNGTRDSLYEAPKAINPIAFIPGHGLLVMGQKTSQGASSALDRVNVARLVRYIKRNLRKSLFQYLFEPNDEITRESVTQMCIGFLSRLLNRRALYDFAVVCDESNNTPDTIDANELWIDIAIKPIKAIEFIYARVKVVRTGATLPTTNR